MNFEWYDWIRCASASIALLTMYFLGRSWTLRRDDYTKRLKDFWWVLNVLLFCLVMGNVESILVDREPTWTLFVGLMGSIIALKASHNKDRTLFKSDNGS